MSSAILLTGHPGVGKTTIIKQVINRLNRPAGGFYTEEIRENGVRAGFKIVTLDGRAGVLAHTNLRSRNRVGRYAVDMAVVETLAVDSIRRAAALNQIVVIDEIGPMELFSTRFYQTVLEIVRSDAAVLGAIVKRRHPAADKIKPLPNVKLLEATIENRDTIARHILALLTE
jgi:nucleoside-triphosphatase